MTPPTIRLLRAVLLAVAMGAVGGSFFAPAHADEIGEAMKALQQQRWSDAVTAMDKTLGADAPQMNDLNRATAYWIRATALNGLQSYALAFDDISKAIDLLPHNPTFRELRMRIALRLKRADIVLDDIAQLEKPGGGFRSTSLSDAVIYTFRAQALALKERYADAVDSLDQAIRLTRGQPVFLYSKAWLLATAKDKSFRRPDEAIALAQKAAQMKESASVLNVLAAAYVAAGQSDAAIAAYERAIELEGRERLHRYQSYLTEHGFEIGREAGRFGPKTKAAIAACVAKGCQLLAE